MDNYYSLIILAFVGLDRAPVGMSWFDWSGFIFVANLGLITKKGAPKMEHLSNNTEYYISCKY